MSDFQKRVEQKIKKEFENEEIRDKSVEEDVEMDISPDKDGKIIKMVINRGLGK